MGFLTYVIYVSINFIHLRWEGKVKVPRKTIKQILINRDNMSECEAENLIDDARENFNNRLTDGQMPSDICSEWFGLEEDYLDELVN